MKSLCLLFVSFFTLLPAALIESTPEKQLEIFNELAAKTHHSEYVLDNDGNMKWVCFNHHSRYKKSNPDSPGLTDADVERMLHFYKLKGITLQRQLISDKGYQMLGAFTELEVASLADIATHPHFKKDPSGRPTGKFILGLDACRKLQVLDITHSFSVSDIRLQDLQGFPELRCFIPDVGASDQRCLAFMKKSPKLEYIKLHRTTITDEELADLLKHLPKLRYVMLKPNPGTKNRISHKSLALYKDHPHIEALVLSQKGAYPLPWKDGLEHLVAAKHLKIFEYPKPYNKKEKPYMNPEDIQPLIDARPDLLINQKHERPIIVDYNWNVGPR